MSNAKHTPGPWVIAGSMICGSYASRADTYVCKIDDNKDPIYIEGNARLIAAAPEMLEALIGAYHLIRYAREKGAFTMMGGDVYIYEGRVNEALCTALGLDFQTVTHEELNAAIARAEGTGGTK